MRKRLSCFLAAIILLVLPLSLSVAQQPTGAFSGKDYVSSKLAPGVRHIEDTVQESARDSMYLVEGNEKAALIDTVMGPGDLAGYVKTLTKLPVIVLITHGHLDQHRSGQPVLDHLFSTEGCGF
jgi:hypothetical protein